MGSIIANRQNASVEEIDTNYNYAYKFPPRFGNYFGSHFIMGGERFDTPQPEAYLFGENSDLNFLGSKPTSFPYPPPQANVPTKTLKSLVNIRRESVKFVKAAPCVLTSRADLETKEHTYNIEFVFDSDAKCSITIYYFCTEEITSTGMTYVSRNSSLSSKPYHYNKGVNQCFSQSCHIFTPSKFPPEDLMYNADKDTFPLVIHCLVEDQNDECRQSHSTICVIDHHSDGTYILRALKQKICVDGLCYLLQEIYGIENKFLNKPSNSVDEDTDDNGNECVICMTDVRDTLILPCRHLCLCNSCADSLRYQANNCPICRAPFRALLQIRAVQKEMISNAASTYDSSNTCEHIPSGYVTVSLLEALNGPLHLIKNTLDSNHLNDETDCLNNCENKITNQGLISDKLLEMTNTVSSLQSLEAIAFEKYNKVCNRGSSQDKSSRLSNNIGKSSKDTLQLTKSCDNSYIINEINASKMPISEVDDDSENEKLSPLLENAKNEKDFSPSSVRIEVSNNCNHAEMDTMKNH